MMDSGGEHFCRVGGTGTVGGYAYHGWCLLLEVVVVREHFVNNCSGIEVINKYEAMTKRKRIKKFDNKKKKRKE